MDAARLGCQNGQVPNTTQTQQGERTRKAIKRFITRYWRKHGVAPALQEIADGVGLTSHNAVRLHLLVLQSRGEVTWVQGRYRTVRVVEKAS